MHNTELTNFIYTLKKKLSVLFYSFRFYPSLEEFRSLAVSKKYNSPCKKKAAFILVRPYAMASLFFEFILALKLREYGIEPIILINDGLLLQDDTATLGNMGYPKYLQLKAKIISHNLKPFPFFVRYSDIIKKPDMPNIYAKVDEMLDTNDFTHEGLDLSEYINESLIRFFRSAPGLTEQEPLYKKYLRQFTYNSLISAEVARRTEQNFAPDIIITSHGFYSSWGPPYSYFKDRGKSVICYGGTVRADAVALSSKGFIATGTEDGFFQNSKKRIDEKTAEVFCNDYMSKRWNGKTADLKIYERNQTQDEGKGLLGQIQKLRSDGKRIYGIFPNILWEGGFAGISTIFDNFVEFMTETINHFQASTDKILLIRAHPSESSWQRPRITTQKIIESFFGMPIGQINNIIWIPSNISIRSYELFPYLDAGIVYNGTIGLELLYAKIPTLITAKAYYANKGFTLDIKSRQEYFRSMDSLDEVLRLQASNRKLLIKFLYAHFHARNIPLRLFKPGETFAPNLSVSADHILKDPNLDHIAQVITKKKDYFQEWLWRDNESTYIPANQ